MTEFRWTTERERAAQLVAEDASTDAEIAAQVCVSKRTLENWKRHPTFQARVAAIVEEFRQAVLTEGIADLVSRVRRANDDWLRLQRLRDARAQEMVGEVPGGDTGLLTRDVKSVGSGEGAREVLVYRVDAALLKEARELERHVAQQLGQWTERKEVTGAGGGSVHVELEGNGLAMVVSALKQINAELSEESGAVQDSEEQGSDGEDIGATAGP